MNIKYTKKLICLALVSSLTLCSCASNEISNSNDIVTIETISNEQELLKYFNELYESTKTLVESNFELGKEASINTFSTLVLFIEGTEQINGYTFDSLSEKGKKEVVNLLANLKTLMTNTYGDFYSNLTEQQQTSLNNAIIKLKDVKNSAWDFLEEPVNIIVVSGTAIVKNLNETETVNKVKTKTKDKWNELIDWAEQQN